MELHECIVGQKVVCRFGDNSGRIGWISSIIWVGSYPRYNVKDANGMPIGIQWSFITSWDLYVDPSSIAPNTLRSASHQSSAKPMSIECPCGIYRSQCDYHR
jgi:hypothetical protein